jgi:2-haloacid dehalogenase
MTAEDTERLVRPDLVVLDVNETLSDLTGMRDVFTAVGLDAAEVEPWFAGVLRDAFALTVLGDNPPFADIARSLLEVRLRASAPSADAGSSATLVMQEFLRLRTHEDVVPGLTALAGLGCRIVTLSNGSADVARTLLDGTAAAGVVEDYLTVADAGAWKPARTAYEHALVRTGVPAGRAMLVAAHPWDIEGARRAGLRTAWINRGGASYPTHFGPAEVAAPDFVALADVLGG